MKFIITAIIVVVGIGAIARYVPFEEEVIIEPVVEEKTAEQLLEEARAQVQQEIADLNAQIETLEAERDRKQELLD